MSECRRHYEHLDGAYLLGALEPGEAAEFEAHLAGCPSCRDRIADLRPTVALLGSLRREEVEAAESAGPMPDTVLPGLLRRAERERTRRRAVLGGLAAVAAAAVAALVVSLWPAGPSSDPAPPTQAFEPVGRSPVAASAQLVAKPWGTRIDLQCFYRAQAGTRTPYRLVVVDVDRHRFDAGGWTLSGSETQFVGGTEVPRDRIRQVQITLSDGRPILELTP